MDSEVPIRARRLGLVIVKLVEIIFPVNSSHASQA